MQDDRERIALALSSYEVGEEIGRGSWGIVVKAHHRGLDRDVAVKQLSAALAMDRNVRDRFVAEARLLAELEHPHIVPIYDYVEHEGLCLLVMELLPGGTLAARHREVGLAAPQACAAIVAVCAALDHAHRHGVLHRDIKPDNVMFSRQGRLKVTDFGIAKVIAGGANRLTQTGMVLGTPAYMAPEQAEGRELTPATDVYGAGSMLYELLCGCLPFADEDSALAVLYKRVNQDPRPLLDARPDIGRDIAAAIDRSIARDPADRYPTAEAFAAALCEAACRTWGDGWLTESGISVEPGGMLLPARLTSAVPGGRTTKPTPEQVSMAPGRRSRRPLVILVLAVVAVVVLGAALSRGGDRPHLAREVSTTTTTTAARTSVRLLRADPGPLPAGTFVAGKVDPRVHFTVGEGWEKLHESSKVLSLAHRAKRGQVLQMLWLDGIVRPADAALGAGAEGAVQPADDAVAWIRGHPRLSVRPFTEGEPAVGDQVIEFVPSKPYRSSLCRSECVVLFLALRDSYAAVVHAGERTRLYMIPTDGHTLVALVSAPEDDFSAFASRADEVIGELVVQRS